MGLANVHGATMLPDAEWDLRMSMGDNAGCSAPTSGDDGRERSPSRIARVRSDCPTRPSGGARAVEAGEARGGGRAASGVSAIRAHSRTRRGCHVRLHDPLAKNGSRCGRRLSSNGAARPGGDRSLRPRQAPVSGETNRDEPRGRTIATGHLESQSSEAGSGRVPQSLPSSLSTGETDRSKRQAGSNRRSSRVLVLGNAAARPRWKGSPNP